GNIAPFLGLIEKSLQLLSNRDFQKFDEKYIKMLIVAFASLGSAFYVITERESDAGGYIDVEMYIRPNNTKKHHQYVMEVKYIKKDSEKTLESAKEEAKSQLQQYLQTDKLLQSKEMLHPLIVIFVKDSLYWEEICKN
ncbi:MAG: PD-(D/E)XK nuclease domain-containing protein, partial [Bacteroidia bacterium]|nr:PD-(D/E)XK nuclease domain-containing protein [Bacteroidia bacterium]